MPLLTQDLLKRLCPNARPDYIAALIAGYPELAAAGIEDNPPALAACMANVCHETGGLTIVRESTNYTSASRLMSIFPVRYRIGAKVAPGGYDPDGNGINDDADGDGLSDLAEAHVGHADLIANYNYGFRLGNEDNGLADNDGYDFRGGGPLQATGREMYRFLEKETGVPFSTSPKLIEDPRYWVAQIIATWKRRTADLTPIAEQGNFEACCRAINTGSPFSKIDVVGLDERIEWFRKWTAALKAAPKTVPGVYVYGSPRAAPVETMQARLNALRYAEGRLVADGVFGTRTRSAVMDFQLENHMTPDGTVTPQVMAAIMGDAARPFPAPGAVALGVGEMAKTDPDIKAAKKDQAAAVALGTAATAKALVDTGALDALGDLAKQLSGWQTGITTLTSAVKFGVANLMFVACAVAAVILYRKYGAVVFAKVEFWTRPIEPAKTKAA